VDFAFSIGDKLYADNLWLFIEVESDDQGLRTSQSIAMEEHICSAVRAGKNVGWTPLVTGGKPSCCRSVNNHIKVEKCFFNIVGKCQFV